jgi:hypothetical protein
MSLPETIVFSSHSPIRKRLDEINPNSLTFDLSATMGDYPTSRKLCPESDGIKLVSYLMQRLFAPEFHCKDARVRTVPCYSGK